MHHVVVRQHAVRHGRFGQVVDERHRVASRHASLLGNDLANRLHNLAQFGSVKQLAVDLLHLELTETEIGKDRCLLRFFDRVALGLTLLDLVERWLRHVDVTAIHKLWHHAIEERQQQRADVGAVNIGVRHHDDLAVAQLLGFERFVDEARANRTDDGLHFLVVEDVLDGRLLDIEDLTAQRQDGLMAHAALLGRAACRVTLNQEQFGVFAAGALLTIREFCG